MTVYTDPEAMNQWLIPEYLELARNLRQMAVRAEESDPECGDGAGLMAALAFVEGRNSNPPESGSTLQRYDGKVCPDCGGPGVTWEDGYVLCDACARKRAIAAKVQRNDGSESKEET